MLQSLCDGRWWWSESPLCLLAWCRDYQPLPMPRPHPCSAVPGPLAFLVRPLSNPREEADGPCFLCTNQGGICSLTDTSPLPHVSSHIHYSFSLRWATVKGREQTGGWASGGEEDAWRGDESLSCPAPAASSSWYSSVPQSFLPRQGRPCNIWVKPKSSMCFSCLFSYTLYISFISLFWWQLGTIHLDSWMSKGQRRLQSSSGTQRLFKGQMEDNWDWPSCNHY